MSNKILLRFASESTNAFDKFNFDSENVTYKEILEFLGKRKKIGSAGKTDQVTIYNLDRNNIEITEGIVDAGTRILVERRPPEHAIKQ